MANPSTLLIQPIANNGTRNEIPNTTTTSGKMSQAYGFPPECSQPLNAGGYAPLRQDINGALYLLSGYAMMAQRGGVWQYDSAQNYEVPAFVQDASDGNYYFCKAANGPTSGTTIAPHSDTSHTYWTPMVRLIIDSIYPVGSIYMSVNSTSPATLFGGTWEQIQGKFLLASSTDYSLGSTGGDANLQAHSHILTVEDATMSHNHTGSGSTTDNGAHTHTRGSMNITGQLGGTRNDYESPTGAFYKYSYGGTFGPGNATMGYMAMDASRNWTGATSSNGSHTHNVSLTINSTSQTHTHTATCANAGTGAGGNMPPYLAVNVWKRTA